MTASGHKQKGSQRAYLVCNASESGRSRGALASPRSAKRVKSRVKSSHGQPQQILASEAAVNVSFGRSRSQTDMTAFALAGTLASWRRMRVGKATS
jgi:hypothetical protein